MKKLALIVTTLVLHLGVLLFAGSHEQGAKSSLTPRVVWFDIFVNDLERTQEFYGKLFGWKVTPLTNQYHTIETKGVQIGGLIKSPGNSQEGRVTIYFEVEDVKAKLELAKILGAKVILEPKNIPQGEGSFAVFRDLEGNPMGLFSKNPI